MSRSLTTLIDITFDFEALNKNYIVYKVSLGKNLKHVDYARKLSLVERSSKPTALISHSGYY